MGQGESSEQLVVLQTKEQSHFKALRLKGDVAEILRVWKEEAAPLALTSELFSVILNLSGKEADVAEDLFRAFDTDQNKKVDAFEVLSAAIILADGSVEEKLEALLPIFDFSGAGSLNFDEVDLLLTSSCRGLAKVCSVSEETDEVLIQACRQGFDSHNLPYDRNITKEQLKRWMRHDVEVVRFVDRFQKACTLAEMVTTIAEKEEAQAAVFQAVCEGNGEVDVEVLARSTAFRSLLGDPTEETWRWLLRTMAGGNNDSIDVERFAEGTRAWNAFCALDVSCAEQLPTKQVQMLHWLSQADRPAAPQDLSSAEQDAKLKSMGIQGSTIKRSDWVAGRLLHVPSGSPEVPEAESPEPEFAED